MCCHRSYNLTSHDFTWSHDVTWHHMMSHGHMASRHHMISYGHMASHDVMASHDLIWSHDVMWPHSNPFHCISPGKSQSISLRQQRTPSHWNTEIDDYASWNQHSEKDKHTRTRDRGEVSTPGCSLILRLFSFYKRSLGMRIRATREVCTQLTVSYSAFPPRATQKKFSGSEPSWITTLAYVGCEGTSHTLTDSIQPSRVFHCSYFVISHDLSTNHYTHYITVMSWFVHQSESLHHSYTDRLNAIQTLKSIPLQPKTKCDKTLLQLSPQFIFPQIITSHYITMSRFAVSYFINHGSHFPYILCGQRERADPQRGVAIIMWSYHASCPYNSHCIHQPLHHKSPPIITPITSLLCHDLFTNQTHYISPTSNMVLPICSACMASSWVAWLLIQM